MEMMEKVDAHLDSSPHTGKEACKWYFWHNASKLSYDARILSIIHNFSVKTPNP